ncbi:hypothetical protein [Sulfolobus ellipsoid virus 1]|uniref:Uncharacterized protein n=1 Tax=Sulfolobus ellipsoid virus 1 TaxID=2056194 RepID=A0A2H4RBQ6_9VIRU|nr:hypothetical protein FGG62_gp37 [Sulfolobus ellipsoid virus 1]ATY46515.1 hypothetical protein [Sulfolobus ellipsoid virus 1]
MLDPDLEREIKEYILNAILQDWGEKLPCFFKFFNLTSWGIDFSDALEIMEWFRDTFKGENLPKGFGVRKNIGFFMLNPFLMINVYLELEYVMKRRVLEVRLITEEAKFK